LLTLPVESLVPGKYQPRTRMDQESLWRSWPIPSVPRGDAADPGARRSRRPLRDHRRRTALARQPTGRPQEVPVLVRDMVQDEAALKWR
jgi:hypothetical protein